MKKTIVILVILSMTILLSFNFSKKTKKWNKDTQLYQVLFDLGEKPPKHYIKPSEEAIKTGEHLVKKDWVMTPEGEKGKPISKHYLCTTCHNIEREDPDLRKADPVSRLS